MTRRIFTNATKNAVLPDSAEAGKPIVIQLAPAGEYPQFIDDTDENGDTTQKEVVQILDEQAMNTLVANFEKARKEAEAQGRKYGVLVDADHSSETSTNTAAMGWVTKLYVDPEKGLMAEIEPTSLGAEKINGKVYRFVSGAWTLDDDNRPQELVSIGLTNKPNLPVAPMINAQAAKKEEPGTQPTKDGEGVTAGTPSATANADENKGGENADAQPARSVAQNANPNSENKEEGEISMTIKEKLGLPEEATDAEVETAVDALVEESKFAENVRNAMGYPEGSKPADGYATLNEEVLEAVNACVNRCGELQAKNEEIEKEKLEGEAEEFVSANADVIPEEMTEEIKNEYVEDKEKAEVTVANFRKVHDRAVLNAAKAATVKKEPVKKAINWREAKKPVALNFEAALAEANGDPEKENEIIRNMCAKH